MPMNFYTNGYAVAGPSRNAHTRLIAWLFIAVAFGSPLPAHGGILYYGPALGRITGGSEPLIDFGLPGSTAPQVNELNALGTSSSGHNFTYSVVTGAYIGVSSHSVALVIPDGVLSIDSDAPIPGHRQTLQVQAYNAGLIGQNLITTAGMRLWGELAPGDQLVYSFGGGTRNSAGIGEAGRTFSAYDIISTPGDFAVQYSYISDIYATGPFGLDLKMSMSFTLEIWRGNSTQRSIVYIDPGVGTYESGTTPDFSFIDPPSAVPEPSSWVLLGGCLATFLGICRFRKCDCRPT